MVKPQVEMTEMKIEQYVPRGKNKSVEGVAVPDSEGDELTEEEQALLRKYALPPGAEPWRPSLIAFPKYQLLPTPVHAVKHSTRTVSMFIDVLRSLQEPGFLGSAKDSLPSQLGVSIFLLSTANFVCLLFSNMLLCSVLIPCIFFPQFASLSIAQQNLDTGAAIPTGIICTSEKAPCATFHVEYIAQILGMASICFNKLIYFMQVLL